MQMEISGLETAIMEEAKGYETLIMCYHYCHGYCCSWLSMQGWKEECKILCNPVGACDTITNVLKVKKKKIVQSIKRKKYYGSIQMIQNSSQLTTAVTRYAFEWE